MTQGHKEGQALFEALGRQLGYEVRRSFSPSLPTDGVWYTESRFGALPPVPVVAIELIVSEASKTIRGSLVTLELVSPALGILLVHEEEIRRGVLRKRGLPTEADARIAATRSQAAALAAAARQRIEVWAFADLVRLYRQATGSRSLYRRGGTRPAAVS